MSPFTVHVPLNVVPSAPVKVYWPPPLADLGWTLNTPSPVTARVSPALSCAEFGTSRKNMYEFDSLFGAVAVEAAGQRIVSAVAARNSSMKRCFICYLLCSPVIGIFPRFGMSCNVRPSYASHVSTRERKVVTVLFADLVSFTSRAEELDPEDVDAMLAPYHDRLRYELERWGGTVEKFIGDAVVAFFGAPVAGEDDPERAVRAALAIRDWVVDEAKLQVRIAVNTGEALVRLDARP